MNTNQEKLIALLKDRDGMIDDGSSTDKKLYKDWLNKYKKILVDVLFDIASGKATLPTITAFDLACALEESITTGKTPELFKSLPTRNTEPYQVSRCKDVALLHMVLAEKNGPKQLKQAKLDVHNHYGVTLKTVNNWLQKLDRSRLNLSLGRTLVTTWLTYEGQVYKKISPPRRRTR